MYLLINILKLLCVVSANLFWDNKDTIKLLRHSILFSGIEKNTNGIVLCLSLSIIHHFRIFDFISMGPSKRPLIQPLSLYFDCTHNINSFNWWLKMLSRAHQKYWHSSYCLGALLSSAFFREKHTEHTTTRSWNSISPIAKSEWEFFECCIEIPE